MGWSALLEMAPEVAVQFGVNVLLAIVIFFVGKWVARRLVAVGKRLMDSQGIDPTVGGFVSNIGYFVLLAIVIIAALSRLGVPTASFIAVVGAAGLAIGLALQGSLSNFASGVLLVSFRPCKVGDYIEGGGVSGTVQNITVFSTTLLTPDQRVITIPNSRLLDGPIVNFSTSPRRRLDLEVAVSFDADIDQVKSVLRGVVEADARVLSDEAITIGLSNMAQSSLNFIVRPWVTSENYWALKMDLNESIKRELDTAGIGIPYPQLDVHINR